MFPSLLSSVRPTFTPTHVLHFFSLHFATWSSGILLHILFTHSITPYFNHSLLCHSKTFSHFLIIHPFQCCSSRFYLTHLHSLDYESVLFPVNIIPLSDLEKKFPLLLTFIETAYALLQFFIFFKECYIIRRYIITFHILDSRCA